MRSTRVHVLGFAADSKRSLARGMSTTAEPGRRRPYDKDLRWRIIYQRIGMTLTYNRIASNLNISTATCQRIYMKFVQTGTIDPVKSTERRDLRRLDEHQELHVIGMILNEPSMYLGELCQQIQSDTGLEVSPATVCRLLKRYGMTRKKIRQVAKQRCYSLRGAFMAQSFMFSRNMFVWVDETGADSRDHIRKYGYAFQGMTPESKRLLVRGKRTNAVVGLTSSGIIASKIAQTTMNGETFFDFARGSLLPMMQPFDGRSPHSILIMDNCSIHHVAEVKNLFQQAGIVVLFLPPYSPDLNPVEEAFSYVKNYLRKHDQLLQAIPDPTDVIQAALDSITPEHCNGWINHSGYT